MKSALSVAVAATLAGLSIGLAITWTEFGSVHELFIAEGTARQESSNDISSEEVLLGAAPKVVVLGGGEYEFGDMVVGAELEHYFEIKNEGDAPLVLEKVENTSCKCTIAELPKEKIQPGQSGRVLIKWKTEQHAPQFRQYAELSTNDPEARLIRLSVSGSVTENVRVVPRDIAFVGLGDAEVRTAQVRVFAYHQTDLEVLDADLLVSDSASSFDISKRPLTPEEVAAEPAALTGWAVDVTVKPGLPLGSIQQTIRLHTNLDDAQSLDVPVEGNVISDIALTGGPEYRSDFDLVILGGVPRDKGRTFTMNLFVKGPYRDDVKITVASTDPSDVLQARIGEPQILPTVRIYPLIIEIPPGSRPVNRRASFNVKPGEVLLETTHPRTKKVRVRIDFAVEG